MEAPRSVGLSFERLRLLSGETDPRNLRRADSQSQSRLCSGGARAPLDSLWLAAT